MQKPPCGGFCVTVLLVTLLLVLISNSLARPARGRMPRIFSEAPLRGVLRAVGCQLSRAEQIIISSARGVRPASTSSHIPS